MLGSTMFSFTNPLHARRCTFEQVMRKIAELNIGPGLEVIGFQLRGFPHVSDDFAARFRDLVAELKLKPTSLAINADVAIRRGTRMDDTEMARYLEPQIRAAAKLGFPVVRSQFGASAESTRQLVPLLESLNIKLGPEVHAPLGVKSPPVMQYREMYDKVNSPCLGFVPDFGATAKGLPPAYLEILRAQGVEAAALDLALTIWRGPGEPGWKREEFNRRASEQKIEPTKASALSVMFSILSSHPPAMWAEIIPQVVHVHGKFYEVDDGGVEHAIPYEEILPVFVKGGYRGSMSSEWEGHMFSQDDGFDQVQRHHAMCKRILAQAGAAVA
jgi:sugar phosphate isomerase/epimerase